MTDKVIIQALRLCSCETSTRNCPTCPLSGNDDCVTDALREAADLIERLTAERDAALADLTDARSCKTCKYACDTRDCSSCKSKTCKCRECHLDKNAWEWRGLPKAQEEGDT